MAETGKGCQSSQGWQSFINSAEQNPKSAPVSSQFFSLSPTDFRNIVNEQILSPLLKVSFTNWEKRFFGSKKKNISKKIFSKNL